MDAESIRGIVKRMLNPMRHRVNLMISRVVLDAVDDARTTQQVQVRGFPGEVLDDVEHMQPGGLTHVAGSGAEGLILCVGGEREKAVAAFLAERAKRPMGLAQGETALYLATGGGEDGIKVYLMADGLTLVGHDDPGDSGSDFVALAAKVKADLDKIKTDLGNVKTTFDVHQHPTAALGPPSPPVAPVSISYTNVTDPAAEKVKAK